MAESGQKILMQDSSNAKFLKEKLGACHLISGNWLSVKKVLGGVQRSGYVAPFTVSQRPIGDI